MTMQLKLFTPIASDRRHKKRNRTIQSVVHQHAPWDLWTEQRETEQDMALLFLDIRNFTPLTGTFEATDVIHLVKKLLSAFQRIVRNHHGRIIETTGDGFYAAFGFHESIDQAVNNAVTTGSAILRYLDIMNEASFQKNLDRKIEAGIGIHAGKVATGRISLGGIEHLMVMGHAVNIASRLQNATKELNNNFIISAAAFELLNTTSQNACARINLKGVKEEFDVRLMGRKYSD